MSSNYEYINESTARVIESKVLYIDSQEFDNVTFLDEEHDVRNKRYKKMYPVDIFNEFKSMQEDVMRIHIPILTRLLEENPYDDGYESVAERYYNDLYDSYGIIAETILQNIYLNNMYENKHLLKHLLFIVANLEKERRTNLEIIPLAGISNPDIEVQDLSVKCIESWDEKKHIPTLSSLLSRIDVEWFKNYVSEVLEQLKEG